MWALWSAVRRSMSCWIGRWRRSTVVTGRPRRRWPGRCCRLTATTSTPPICWTAPGDGGEIRRLTILFADLVDSTVLSTRVEPETYRLLVGRYRDLVLAIVDRYEGHIGSTKGDGLLAVFGHPTAHEDDVRRAVLAGLEITREVSPAQRAGQAPLRRLRSLSGWGCTAGWCIWTPPRTTCTGWPPIWPRGCRVWRRPGTVVVSDAVAPLVRGRLRAAGPPGRCGQGCGGAGRPSPGDG